MIYKGYSTIITIALFVICRAECEYQVKGHPRARYKKFNTEEEAQKFITQVIFCTCPHK